VPCLAANIMAAREPMDVLGGCNPHVGTTASTSGVYAFSGFHGPACGGKDTQLAMHYCSSSTATYGPCVPELVQRGRGQSRFAAQVTWHLRSAATCKAGSGGAPGNRRAHAPRRRCRRRRWRCSTRCPSSCSSPCTTAGSCRCCATSAPSSRCCRASVRTRRHYMAHGTAGCQVGLLASVDGQVAGKL